VTVSGNRIVTAVPPDALAGIGLEPQYRFILAEFFNLPSVPDAPALVTAFGVDSAAYVAWNPTFVNHGLPVYGYRVTASPGGQSATVSVGDFQRLGYAVVPGLVNGTAYTFTVQALNLVGASASSLPSPVVTPTATLGAVPAAVPTLSARPGQDAVSLHWNPPSMVGGTPVIGYRISGTGIPTTMVTGHTELWANNSRDIFTTIGGLDQLTPYTFQISAVNAAGAGPATSVGPVILAPTTACAGANLAVSPRAALTEPGSTAIYTVTLTNGCTTTLHSAHLYLFAPPGYAGSPASPLAFGDLAPGQAASQDVTVGVPADAPPAATLIWQTVFTDDAGTREGLRTTSTVSVPAPSLAAAFTNVGTTDDANPGAGNIDGSGSSFSAQALASVGVTPGGTISYRGLSFTWPAGEPDNVVAAGQAFHLTGTGGTLGMLVTATYGPASGTGRIRYTDGTSDPFTVTVPDWVSGRTSPDIAVTAPYRNRPTGPDAHPVCVFFVSVPLAVGKTVSTVILPPGNGAVPTAHVPALHVFAVAVGDPG
jgi:hypothetical protein